MCFSKIRVCGVLVLSICVKNLFIRGMDDSSISSILAQLYGWFVFFFFFIPEIFFKLSSTLVPLLNVSISFFYLYLVLFWYTSYCNLTYKYFFLISCFYLLLLLSNLMLSTSYNLQFSKISTFCTELQLLQLPTTAKILNF